MDAVFRHFWVMALGSTLLNAAIWWWNGRQYRASNPALAAGYRSLTRGFVVWGSLPWLVMGAGAVLGGTRVFDYFDPSSGNPWILAWHASVVSIWALLAYWTFLRGGAELIARHPGLLMGGLGTSMATPAWAVKALVAICIGSGVVAMLMMFLVGFPPR